VPGTLNRHTKHTLNTLNRHPKHPPLCLDFKSKIVGRGGVFQPLEDIEFFRQVKVDPEIGTLVWPNGVDFCPDVLYSEATGTPLPQPARSK